MGIFQKELFQLQYSFFFYPLNPWFRQIDMVLNRAFDAGIRDLWFERAKYEFNILHALYLKKNRLCSKTWKDKIFYINSKEKKLSGSHPKGI